MKAIEITFVAASIEAGTFFGRVSNLPRDGITFEGVSVDELRSAFRASVDDYLAWCEERGEASDKPYSGKFNIRISPELHANPGLASHWPRARRNHSGNP